MKNLILYWCIGTIVLLLAFWLCIFKLIQEGKDIFLYPVVLVTMVVLMAIALGVRTYLDDNKNIEE